MNIRQVLCRLAVCVGLLVCLGSSGAWAQNAAVRSRVVQPVDDTVTVRLPGNVHPLAKAQFDQGALPDSQPMTHMLLLLQRSPEQELALRQLMDAQLTKNSGSYHAWLTPEQFGQQFGPSDADVQAVTDWLTRQGFRINKVAAGKTVIDFDGNVAQVRSAFQTDIHRFVINGEEHFANVKDPAIPLDLSPVVSGVVALHNFPKHSYVRKHGAVSRNKETGRVEPLFTTNLPGATYLVGPGDWNTIYSNTTGATGAGQTIAIVADSNINPQDVAQFRELFGITPAYTSSNICQNPTLPIPANCQFSIIVNGPDPGLNGDEGEADLDTQWAGAIASSANIVLVVSEDTVSNPLQVSAGIDLSALFIIDNNIGSILSESFGSCEPFLLTAGNQFYNSLWEQAASQGITVAIAAGDNGSAACDPLDNFSDPAEPAATLGVAVNGIASTPFNVAVGGTDFDPSTTNANAATYWTTTAGTINSALSYVPEITWNESTCAFNSTSPCNTVDTSGNQLDITAGGGGPSNSILCGETASGALSCPSGNTGYSKPSWQGTVTPGDGARDLPDVSFFASAGGPQLAGNGNFSGASLVVCESDALPTGVTSCDLNSPYQNFSMVGGTSAATPAFAAVMALVDASQVSPTNPQGRQGNANYVLYALAAQDTANYQAGLCETSKGGTSANAGTPQMPAAGCVFNDVNKGNIAVACVPGSASAVNGFTTWCSGTGTFGLTSSTSGLAYGSGPEYDYATGLGSINVKTLLAKWTSGFRTATTTAVTGATGVGKTGTPFNATVSVTPSAATGSVSLIALASDQATVLGTFGPFTVSGGAATATTTLLPAGTAFAEASYSGDATHAASTSTPFNLNATESGAGYTAQTTLLFVNGSSQTTTSSQNFAYGTPYSLAIVVGQGNQNCSFAYPNTKPPFPCPTGYVKLTTDGSPSPDFTNGTSTLNNLGIAEDQIINLSATLNGTTPGAHQLSATYCGTSLTSCTGDANYVAPAGGAVSNTLKITIQKATPSGLAVGTSLSSITPGASVTLTGYVVTTSNGLGPGGSIQFSANGSVLGSGTCTSVSGVNDATPPISAIAQGSAYCVATLTTTSITGLYPPPDNPGMPRIPRVPLVVALLSLLLFVLGLRWVPQTRRRAYTYAGLLAVALLVGVVAGCGGGGGGGSTTPPGSTTVTITAAYQGDSNYNGTNGTTTITVQ